MNLEPHSDENVPAINLILFMQFVLFEFVGIKEYTFTIIIKLIVCSMLKFKAISKNTKEVDSTCKNYLAFQKFVLRIGFTFF